MAMNCRRFGRVLTVLGVVWISTSISLFAQTSRALLVGINHYERSKPGGGREIRNLKGCLNDVEAMRQLLETKFHFKSENIRTLTDATDVKPTRQAITDGIGRLIAESSPGDVALFYYSGHGSLAKNAKSGELNQTIVPADYDRAEDIRDKEFVWLFNDALDKGIILTGIFDSCYSGGITRGFSPDADLGKSAPSFMSDASYPDDPRGKPEERKDKKERGILVLKATQDVEIARETSDEEAPQGCKARGAFSLALTRILATVPENERASWIFNRLPSTIYTNGNFQIPVFTGTAERMAAPLFGFGTASVSQGTRVATLQVNGDTVEIHGGSALGLATGCELKMEEDRGQSPVRIRVTEVKDLARSTATVIAGSAAAVKSGSMFLVDKWTYSGASGALKAWWPRSSPTLQEIADVRIEMNKLKDSQQIVWIEDPTENSPDWLISHNGRSWALKKGAGLAAELKRPFQAQEILDTAQKLGRRPKIFVAVPAPLEIAGKLALGSGTANDALIRTEKEGEADYALVGHFADDGIQVAWMAQNRVKDQIQTPLPVRSEWRPVNSSAESMGTALTALEEDAQKLMRVKGWLSLQSMNEDASPFPYHLGFKNVKTEKVTSGNEPLVGGEIYNLVLVRDKNIVESALKNRRLYVFAIDSWGKGSLLYPGYGEVGNSLDRLATGGDIVLKDETAPFTIGTPYGYDAYFLLTSEEPLGDLSILDFGGVRTRGAKGGESSLNPLARLLQRVGSASRGEPLAAPSHWTIDHVGVKSVPAK
jgi:hypothetical protein